jgi:hypothetical protein
MAYIFLVGKVIKSNDAKLAQKSFKEKFFSATQIFSNKHKCTRTQHK